MFLGFLGVGFGLPTILEAPETIMTCGRQDFDDLIEEFGLKGGLQPLFDGGHSKEKLKSLVKEFSVLIYSKHECITINEYKNIESYRVKSAFKKFLASLKLRIDEE